MEHAHTVREARMRRSRIDEVGKPELLNTPQTLERLRLKNTPQDVIEF